MTTPPAIAEQVLQVLANKIAPVLKSEVNKLVERATLVHEMKQELLIIKDFLNKYEEEEERSEEPIKKKVKEVREIMFKIEDILDDEELLLEQRQRARIQSQRRDDQNGCSMMMQPICRFLRNFFKCNDDNDDGDGHNYAQLEQQEQLLERQEQLLGRQEPLLGQQEPLLEQGSSGSTSTNTNNNVDSIWDMIDELLRRLGDYDYGTRSFTRRYRGATNINRTRKKLEKMKKSYGGTEKYESIFENKKSDQSSHSGSNKKPSENQKQDDEDPGIVPMYKDESEFVGLQVRKDKIIELLDLEMKSCSKGSLVAVWGVPGSGKTKVVHKVYEDKRVVDKFGSVRVWISANKCHCKPLHLLRSLFKQFGLLNENGASNELNNEVLIANRLRNHIMENQTRYLVILDEVAEMEELSQCIKAALVPSHSNGGRILITTSSERIANYWKVSTMPPNGVIYNLPTLSELEAKQLLEKKAFGKGKCPIKLIDIRDDVVKNCDGLPFVIEKVGAAFSTTQNWIELYHNFLCNPLLTVDESIVFLSRMYHKMPSYLRPCFLYLAMFPKGELVDRMRVVRLWIAEGFISSHGNKTLEEVAGEYLDELVERSMIYSIRDETGRPKSIKLLNFWYLLLNSKLVELSFAQVLPHSHHMIMSSEATKSQCRRLSIHQDVPMDTIISPSVRSILSFVVEHEIFPICWQRPYGQVMFRLRVLDLEGAKFEKVSKHVHVLHNLRYLSLRGTMVSDLEFIDGLWNLQTLNLKDTKVKSLPEMMNHLHKLRHLLVRRYKGTKVKPMEIPKGILGNFTELQKLAVINASSIDMFELGKLKQLRRLVITNLKKQQGTNLCQAIKEMKYLRSLSVTTFNYDGACSSGHEMDERTLDLDHFKDDDYYPEYLEGLHLIGPLENRHLPEWISHCARLVKLRLVYSNFANDPLDDFGQLQDLLVLELVQAYDGETLDFMTQRLPNLKILRLYGLHNLTNIKLEELYHARKLSIPKIEHKYCFKLKRGKIFVSS